MNSQDKAVAEQLLEAYLPWSEKKWAADQKWLKSILDAWGF
jgi:hypothetical protein